MVSPCGRAGRDDEAAASRQAVTRGAGGNNLPNALDILLGVEPRAARVATGCDEPVTLVFLTVIGATPARAAASVTV
jgi:hypothetical protein